MTRSLAVGARPLRARDPTCHRSCSSTLERSVVDAPASRCSDFHPGTLMVERWAERDPRTGARRRCAQDFRQVCS